MSHSSKNTVDSGTQCTTSTLDGQFFSGQKLENPKFLTKSVPFLFNSRKREQNQEREEKERRESWECSLFCREEVVKNKV